MYMKLRIYNRIDFEYTVLKIHDEFLSYFFQIFYAAIVSFGQATAIEAGLNILQPKGSLNLVPFSESIKKKNYNMFCTEILFHCSNWISNLGNNSDWKHSSLDLHNTGTAL